MSEPDATDDDPEPVARPLRGIAALATLVLAGLVGYAALRPALAPTPLEERGGPAPPCPPGFVDRPARGARLRGRLEAWPPAAEALAATEDRLRYCFGDAPRGVIQGGRVLLLTHDAEEAAQAARLAHLLRHAARGDPLPEVIEPDADCARLVDEALEAEGEAYALELGAREWLGLPAARYPFEAAARALDPDARAAAVARWLREHPDGGAGVDGLASAYAQRCDLARVEGQ